MEEEEREKRRENHDDKEMKRMKENNKPRIEMNVIECKISDKKRRRMRKDKYRKSSKTGIPRRG